MATSTYRESAKILAFPKGRRAGPKCWASTANFVGGGFPANNAGCRLEAWYHRKHEDEGKAQPVN